MLSILIPCYNYDISELITIIYQECKKLQIQFEIIIVDDCSSDVNSVSINKTLIDKLPEGKIIYNAINLGRAKTRNLLVNASNFNWLLFLDADVIPVKNDFIFQYVQSKENLNHLIYFGGIKYHDQKPESDKILRWKYGKKREEIDANKRALAPYQYALVSNTLIHKSVFDKVVFNDNIKQYGYEDIVFFHDLKKEEVPILHLDNPCYHLNYEKSIDFVNKMEKSAETLYYVENQKLITEFKSSFQTIIRIFRKFRLLKGYVFFISIFEKPIKKNILSKNPSLFLFDLYRLFHFCKLNK